jgi:hypothetical protein
VVQGVQVSPPFSRNFKFLQYITILYYQKY